MLYNKRMQLSARVLWSATGGGRRPSVASALRRQLRVGPPGGVWSVHGGRQLMREPLGGANQPLTNSRGEGE